MPFVPSGDTFSVDAYVTTAPAGPSGDSFSVDAYVYPAPPPVSAIATMNVDVNEIALPSPARLKVWDGAQWVPIRGYYYDNVAAAWVPTT